MSAGGTKTTHEQQRTAQSKPHAGRLLRVYLTVRRAALLAGTMIAVALFSGFLWFLSRVPVDEVPLSRDAEGIVVLTGGASRIADAIELLASGRGKRLLITGVYPATNSVELARLVPRFQRFFACCIDLDHSARNTIGNAVETRRWTRERGFRTLVVVTSAYHMPRAIAELSHQLPDVTLIEFPVVSEKYRSESWWTSSTTRLLISEYLKYMFAIVRMRLDLNSPGAVVSGNQTKI